MKEKEQEKGHFMVIQKSSSRKIVNFGKHVEVLGEYFACVVEHFDI